VSDPVKHDPLARRTAILGAQVAVTARKTVTAVMVLAPAIGAVGDRRDRRDRPAER
jgi:hypothetical protein